jgi:hypothetical protein
MVVIVKMESLTISDLVQLTPGRVCPTWPGPRCRWTEDGQADGQVPGVLGDGLLGLPCGGSQAGMTTVSSWRMMLAVM